MKSKKSVRFAESSVAVAVTSTTKASISSNLNEPTKTVVISEKKEKCVDNNNKPSCTSTDDVYAPIVFYSLLFSFFVMIALSIHDFGLASVYRGNYKLFPNKQVENSMIIYITEPVNERVTTSSLLSFQLEGDIFNITNVYHVRPLTVALSVNITLDQRNLQFPNGNKFSIVLNSENANVPTIKLDMNDYGLYDGAHELIVDVYVNTGDNSKILSATKASYFYFHTLTQQTTAEVQQVNNDVAINDASLFSTSKTVQIVYPQDRSIIHSNEFTILFTIPPFNELKNYYFMLNYDSYYYNITNDLLSNIDSHHVQGKIELRGITNGEHTMFIDIHDVQSGVQIERSNRLIITKL